MPNPFDLPEKSGVSLDGPTKVIIPRPDPFAKLNRAKVHFQELERCIGDFFASKPYQTVIYENQGWLHYRFHEVRPIPPETNLIAGDAIHNARAALDQMVAAFVEKGGGNIDRASFPIPKDGIGIKGKIAGKSPKADARARRLLYLLKPYKGGNAKLWLLHSLDLADKHRQVIPVGAANIEVSMIPKIGGLPDGEIPFLQLGNTSRRFVRNGDEFHASPASTNQFTDTKVTVHVCLGDIDGLHVGPVIPVVSDLIKYVERILEIAKRRNLL